MPLVDQTQPEFNAGTSARYIGERSFGQSYIAGKDGWLEGIEVGFFNFLGGDFEVAIYKASPENKFSKDNELGKIILNNSGRLVRKLSIINFSR